VLVAAVVALFLMAWWVGLPDQQRARRSAAAGPRTVRIRLQPAAAWVPVRSAVEAERQVERLWPWVDADFTGADMAVLNPTLTTFAALSASFPEVTRDLRSFRVEPPGFFPKPSIWAMTLPSGGFALNRAWYGNARRFRARFRRTVRQGWHPASVASPEGLMAHEYGHLMSDHYRRGGATWPTLREWLARPARGRWLGRYARRNAEERWAEAFAILWREGPRSSPGVRQMALVLAQLRRLDPTAAR
jgi:hypothetical protein